MTDSKRETTISQNTKQMTMRVVSRVETKVCKRLHTNGRDENRLKLSEIEDLFVGRDCSLGIIFKIKPLLVTKCYTKHAHLNLTVTSLQACLAGVYSHECDSLVSMLMIRWSECDSQGWVA